uniref:Uncharacterized protein n=1 Tax=Anguilla anguilla TaxID=7936 RepID=A0A0E9V648_ANGAN
MTGVDPATYCERTYTCTHVFTTLTLHLFSRTIVKRGVRQPG